MSAPAAARAAPPAHPAAEPAAAFLARARARLRPLDRLGEVRPGDGARDDDPRLAGLDPARAIPAAVLVPVVAHAAPTVLLTRRAATLRAHAGQVAFPGGRVDPGDAGVLDAALREAEEEIGLPRAAVTPLGGLPSYLTGSGFRVHPVVASVAPGVPLRLNPAEVDEAFEVPLAYLMDPANHLTGEVEWRGALRRYHRMPWQGREVWGATAAILREMSAVLYGEG